MVDKDKLKEDINKMYLAEPDRRCYGCIHFDYHPITGAGAPERRPWYECDLLDIRCSTGFTRTQVTRQLECMLCDYKEVRNND